jgi:hypothetical protein
MLDSVRILWAPLALRETDHQIFSIVMGAAVAIVAAIAVWLGVAWYLGRKSGRPQWAERPAWISGAIAFVVLVVPCYLIFVSDRSGGGLPDDVRQKLDRHNEEIEYWKNRRNDIGR